ncbi:MAG TPA: ABC transporter permease [Beijerinckiaceae bacterium]|jgi:osmoprotectant transport system permease protein
MGPLTWLIDHQATFWRATGEHLTLSLTALAVVIAAGLPLAVALVSVPRLAALVIGLANVLRTIPSLALLVVMLPVLGTGFLPSAVALTLYGLPAVLINTVTGLREVEPDVVDAARGQGLSEGQIMARIRLPLAAPVIFAGIRTAAVQIVSAATLAAFIGGGGLGELITAGMGTLDVPQLVTGGLAVAGLAIATELGFGALERRTTRSLRAEAA